MNYLIVGAVLAAAALISARWTWWRGSRPGLPVLCYHKIGTPPAGSRLKDLWVSPDNFRRQMLYLKEKGYETLLFSDLLKIRRGEARLPEKAVVVTFDDGYENNYAHAWKIMSKTGTKGNIFVVFDTIGKANLWHDPASEPWVNMADLPMLKEMQESGVVEYGSHTMSHPKLPKLPLEDADWQMRESKKRLEEALGRELCAFAYPYGAGAYVPEVRALALKYYEFDFSFTQGKTAWPWDRDAGPIDRLFIKGSDTMLDFALQLSRGASRL